MTEESPEGGSSADNGGAGEIAGPGGDGNQDTPGSITDRENATEGSIRRDIGDPIFEPHRMGVTVDLPDENADDIGFE